MQLLSDFWRPDCQQCSLFTHEQVKLAFLKWIEHNLDSIEEQPEWFLNNEPKHFYRHLPFDELQEATDLREYENDDEKYADMCAEMDARINSGEVSQDIHEYIMHRIRNKNQIDNASSLEDEFDGTPEEAAIAAIYW